MNYSAVESGVSFLLANAIALVRELIVRENRWPMARKMLPSVFIAPMACLSERIGTCSDRAFLQSRQPWLHFSIVVLTFDR